METSDAIVIGGGMIGSAIACGLAWSGMDVVVLDEGDDALRAARGNFGLIWVQGKGLGMQRYVEWTIESANLWSDFAAELKDRTGVDVGFRKPGGLTLCLSEDELTRRHRLFGQLRRQGGPTGYDCDFIDHDGVQALFPDTRVGDAVVGASFCRHDGHANPLYLLRAMHVGFARAGGRYVPGDAATEITHDSRAFVVATARERYTASKVVLAAGHGITKLAPMVGLDPPIVAERGQLLVSERTKPIIPLPMSGVRQTEEGTIMLGLSNEDVGFDDGTTLTVIRDIAANAVAALPALAGLQLVRAWAAIRVLTPDGFPIYEESRRFPGAYVTTSHGGVTLAAIHARQVARWIAEDAAPPGFDQFSTRRFDVQKTA